MRKQIVPLLGLAALLGAGACKSNNSQTSTDTTTMKAVDTAAGEAVPTTDTLVQKTTTTTDTLKAKVNADSVQAKKDSMKAASTKRKHKATKKS